MKKKEISEEKEVMTYEEMEGYSDMLMFPIMQEFKYLDKLMEHIFDDDKQVENKNIDDNIWNLINPHITSTMQSILVGLKEKVIMLDQMRKKKIPIIQYYDIDEINDKNNTSIGDIIYALDNYLERHSKDIENDKYNWNRKFDDRLKPFNKFKQDNSEKDKIGIAITMRKSFLKVIETVRDIYEYFVKEIASISALNYYDPDECYEALVEHIREYAKSIEQDEYKNLKRMVMKMKKNRSDVLGREHWCKMLELEEKAMKLASKKMLTESKDEDLEYIKSSDRQLMDENSELFVCMLNVMTDDSLYDMESIMTGVDEDECSAIVFLYSLNIELFARLLLRANIIRSEMNPELKPEYNAWLNGTEIKVEEEESKLCSDLMKPQAMVLWRKLQDAGVIDKKFMPTEKSNCKAAIVANRMMELLPDSVRWAAFEELWGIENMANKLVRSKEAKYFPEYDKFISKILK